MPPLLPGSSILTKSPDSRNGEKGRKTESRKTPLWKRAQLYTTSGSGALRPAGSGLRCRSGRRRANVHRTLCALRTADDFHRFSICSNHHRGSYTSPALAPPATPLWTCRPDSSCFSSCSRPTSFPKSSYTFSMG